MIQYIKKSTPMPKEIKNKDLDFFLETLIRFSDYNISLHNSDMMFADITDVVFRNNVILKLSEDGYITAKQSKNFPNRYEIKPTDKGRLFYQSGGYEKQKNTAHRKSVYSFVSKNLTAIIINAIVALIAAIIAVCLKP